MTKKEYIEKYGEDAYKKHLEHNKKYIRANKDKVRAYYKEYKKNNREYCREKNKQWAREKRSMFAYVIPSERTLIENYDKALADNFEGWDLHHKNEITYGYSREQLIEQNLYYNRPAQELIFLTHAEHTALHRRK